MKGRKGKTRHFKRFKEHFGLRESVPKTTDRSVNPQDDHGKKTERGPAISRSSGKEYSQFANTALVGRTQEVFLTLTQPGPGLHRLRPGDGDGSRNTQVPCSGSAGCRTG